MSPKEALHAIHKVRETVRSELLVASDTRFIRTVAQKIQNYTVNDCSKIGKATVRLKEEFVQEGTGRNVLTTKSNVFTD